jgi:hypothetical protein
MKFHKYIFVSFILISFIAFSQPTFTNIDTLFTRNFKTVSLKDSTLYLKILNQSAIFKGKTAKYKSDSLLILKPFTDAYSDLIESLTEMTLSPDFTVEYYNYECLNSKLILGNAEGKTPIHVNLIINNSFTVKMLFWVTANKGKYSIETPMIPIFVESKE